MNPSNIESFLPVADGFIVGSSFKRGGDWNNPVDSAKVKAFMKQVRR
jgi:predicted TIM-barrel enzyme